jgi:hypothetical protein
MLSFSTSLTRTIPAFLLITCGAAGLGLWAAPVNLSTTQADRELEIYRKARTVVDMTVEELRRGYSKECRDLKFDDNPAELAQLLQKTGESVEALVRDIPNTASKEQVRRERLRENGAYDTAADLSCNYLVLQGQTGFWDEIRTDSQGRALPAKSTTGIFMITSGFAGMVLFFHPQYQICSRFRFLGRQRSEPNAYVIAFAQDPENGQPTGTLETPLTLTPATILYQGLAWVDPQTHQILRMRIDLLAPRQDVLLARQTTEIWFHEVHFKDSPHPFWLPREVLVTIDWNGRTYINRHRYSDYLVFSVESLDKLERPKIKKLSCPTCDSRVQHTYKSSPHRQEKQLLTAEIAEIAETSYSKTKKGLFGNLP